MNLNEIKELVEIIENSSLTQFTVKEGNLKITMSKLENPTVVAQGVPAAITPSSGINVETSNVNDENDDILFITAPIVGTFYSASAPETPAFVRVGDQVKAGETVCILEAMKLMNEIQAEFDCKIESVLVSNEQKVEYGQPLFRVQKL